jgi:hypothetical protein
MTPENSAIQNGAVADLKFVCYVLTLARDIACKQGRSG